MHHERSSCMPASTALRSGELPSLSLYVHLPWCVRKCPYCDFNSYTPRQNIPDRDYVDALFADLDQDLAWVAGRCIASIFIGGGTPSLFSPDSIGRLIRGIRQRVCIHDSAEITLEANPGTVERQRFASFRSAGINRLSIGVQSFQDQLLTRIGRIHSGDEARRAAEGARKAGFATVNLDLMYGLPGQSLTACMSDLREALECGATHVSFYELTIEPNTRFHRSPPTLPDEDSRWNMHVQGHNFLADRGYTQYEVAAHAREGHYCRHNLNYWEFGDYLGIGAGAHSKLTEVTSGQVARRWKFRQPYRFMQQALRGEAVAGTRVLTRQDLITEFALNAFRLTNGFEPQLFTKHTGLPVSAIEPQLEIAERQGLVRRRAQRISPTLLGQRFLNDLVALFVTDEVDAL